jgi:hypothetical protein
MVKRKKKTLLNILVGGVTLGFCKAIFAESKTVRQKIAQQQRMKRRGWLS